MLRSDSEAARIVQADHGLEVLQRVSEALLLEDLQLVVDARVAERRLQEEAVELRLGEREGALVLDRVLGRDEQERVG